MAVVREMRRRRAVGSRVVGFMVVVVVVVVVVVHLEGRAAAGLNQRLPREEVTARLRLLPSLFEGILP